MVHLADKLDNWEEVWPEDLDKPEGHLYYEAADYIRELEAKLAKAVKSLNGLTREVFESGTWLARTEAFEIARATLAELKGEK